MLYIHCMARQLSFPARAHCASAGAARNGVGRICCLSVRMPWTCACTCVVAACGLLCTDAARDQCYVLQLFNIKLHTVTTHGNVCSHQSGDVLLLRWNACMHAVANARLQWTSTRGVPGASAACPNSKPCLLGPGTTRPHIGKQPHGGGPGSGRGKRQRNRWSMHAAGKHPPIDQGHRHRARSVAARRMSPPHSWKPAAATSMNAVAISFFGSRGLLAVFEGREAAGSTLSVTGCPPAPRPQPHYTTTAWHTPLG